ncbi:MAG TPA: pyridoxamine 5'-phosphate oxidase [Verrucomicrobiae bacterium]|nr:pyridoxamine 5'-phosphate oxidase [Verrucomicrobiae bacterium]
MDIADLRREYTFAGLRRRDLHAEPIQQFNNWFQQAISAGVPEPNAMTLGTVDAAGQPSSRIVLLKGIDPRGFQFYTNYRSRKGRELEANPRASLTIYWAGLEREICVRGTCSKLPREESEVYFNSRPIGNRLGAWVSTNQSDPIPNREHLESKLEEMAARFGENPPMPDYWGGYVLKPATIDFWQGRPSRLHDRFLYTREGEEWKIERLSP